MQPFDLHSLLAPFAIIFFATWIIALKMTQTLTSSLLAALIKSGLFLIYFGVFFDGTFTFSDDWSYLQGGKDLIAYKVGITSLADNWGIVLRIGGGEHIVYYLYNAFAIHLFGEGYYAPVALNILLTLLVAGLGTSLAVQEFGVSDIQKKILFFFLLLHPDILAWSNIMNGKDQLVLLLHVVLLISFSLYFRSRIMSAVALAIPAIALLLFLRFYVPFLFATTLVVSAIIGGRTKKRAHYICGGAILGIFAFFWIGSAGVQDIITSLKDNFVNPFYGFIRYVLTPIPFNTDENYSFLNLPALIHWLLISFACWGVFAIYRIGTPFSRFFLCYLACFVGLYSVFGALQGPRHRVQLDYAWAILQFSGLADYIRMKRGANATSMLAPVMRDDT